MDDDRPFRFVGGLRGWQKEIVATAAILLGLFAMQQLAAVLIQPLTQGARPEQVFYVNVIPLLIMAFIGYQAPSTATRTSGGRFFGEGRRRTAPETMLGFVIGTVNAYLLFGTIWYFLDIAGYPFAPYIVAPALNSPSAALVGALPIIFLVQSNLLAIFLIITFLFVIVALL